MNINLKTVSLEGSAKALDKNKMHKDAKTKKFIPVRLKDQIFTEKRRKTGQVSCFSLASR